ncbi:MAG TPA: family 16 glycosylhydrolase [Bacteroidales bacterium]|nr:family 16 glycosylhydrolase [Bacteroidales bacterium]
MKIFTLYNLKYLIHFSSRNISIIAILLSTLSTQIQAQAQTVMDDFEGNGNITTWYGDNCNINTSLPNPYKEGINTSSTVLEYHDLGGQYANVRFDVSNNFDLASNHTFELKIYVPTSGLTGNQTNQVSLKLQDGTLTQPWLTQSEIIKPIILDQWQTVIFDFSTDNYVNLDTTSSPPTQRTDFNRVVIQVNGENNYDQVQAYIDDVYYKASSEPDPNPDPEFDILVWSDEFNTDGAIDNTKWFQESELPTPTSWHNGEIQHYTNRADNSNVKNGFLNIIGKKETYTDQGVTKEYTSARLNSKYAFRYGKVEVRAKLPSGVGTWPAIWTLGKNLDVDGSWWGIQGYGTTPWPECGEIDIMEHWGSNQNYVTSATHTPSSYGNTHNKGGQTISNASSEFHTYTLEWYPDKLIFSVDSISHYTYQPNEFSNNTWPFDAEQYLLLNFAILPEIETNFVKDTLVVDFVRVYQADTNDPTETKLDQVRLNNKINALNLHRNHKNTAPYDLNIKVISSTEFESQKPSDALPFDCGFVDKNGKVFVSEPSSAMQLDVFPDINQAAVYYMCQSFLQHYYQASEMPIWFKSGFAAYESGISINDADIKIAYNNYNGTLTSFDALNDPIIFTENNGLAIAYLFGEFMGVYTPWNYHLFSEVDAFTVTPAPWWNNVESIEKLFQIWLRYFNVRILETNEQNRIKLGKETEHFKYYYSESLDYWAATFPEILESALNEYIGLFGFDTYEKFSYITMPECDFATINDVECINRYTGGTAWSSGVSSTSPVNLDHVDRFTHLIRHELAHLVQSHLPVGNMTAWLNEGFAEFLARRPDTKEVKESLKAHTQSALDNAVSYFGHLPTFEDTRVYPGQSNVDYYLLGRIMQNFIYEKGGYNAVKEVMLDHEAGIANIGFSSPEQFMNAYYYYLEQEYLQKEVADYLTDYDSFIAKLTELTSTSNHATELDAFWNELIASGNFPFAIGSEVAFLYRGSANSVSWAGDFNQWDPVADPGVRLGVSNIWLLEKELPSDARSGYKIVINTNKWIADENNPYPLSEEYGNSDLRMPDYTIPEETILRPSIPKGELTDNILIFSSNLNYTCQYKVYTPSGYSELSGLPVIYVTDGQDFADESKGKMKIILDNLIYDGLIEPVIAVFLDPRDPTNLSHNRRSNEYRNNINFVKFVTNELIPDIDAAYKTEATPGSRAIAGYSYGGYNAAYFCAMADEDIYNTAILSPIMHPNPPDGNYSITNDILAANLENTKIYMSYGIFDSREKIYFDNLKSIFEQKNKAFEYDIVHEGHTLSNWSGVIGNALMYFFSAVEKNYAPLVSDIPNQIYYEGNEFTTIQLDDFVTDQDHPDAEITWTYSGNTDLTVSIDENRIATISAPQNWTGSETITFIATDPEGEFSSDQVTFTLNTETMISREIRKTLFSFYPNPATDKVTITFQGETDLSVFTITGQKVMEKKIVERDHINISDFMKGVYLLSFRYKDGLIIEKLMVE